MLLPYFRRQESWEGGADAYRGGDGPLATCLAALRRSAGRRVPRGGRRRPGLPATRDYNGAQQEGFGPLQNTIRNGRRCSAAVAYLRPALARPNLAVEAGALASRVVLDGTRAVGRRVCSRRRAQRRRAPSAR